MMWNVSNIFDVRGELVQIKGGILYAVRLYADGWAVWEQSPGIDKVSGMSAVDFARWLNDRQAIHFKA